MSLLPLKDRAQGRWLTILPACGVDARYLTGKHGPCPICQRGTDRFRFDNKQGNGTYICNACGAGDGIGLVMAVNSASFKDTAKMIEDVIGKDAPIDIPPERDERKCREDMNRLWRSAAPVVIGDHVDRYLRARGIILDEFPACLRSATSVRYSDGGAHPAMLAKLISSHGKPATIHRTYLTNDGSKANVPSPRMLMPGTVPAGSAVRLSEAGEILGIAEGIETALAASILFKVPVWSAISAPMMGKFVPPEGVKHVIVFGDNDHSHTGQTAAHGLAQKLIAKGIRADVQIPKVAGEDWNDVLMFEQRAADAQRMGRAA